jgi:hypothetical protein
MHYPVVLPYFQCLHLQCRSPTGASGWMSPRAHLYSSPTDMSSEYQALTRLSACGIVHSASQQECAWRGAAPSLSNHPWPDKHLLKSVVKSVPQDALSFLSALSHAACEQYTHAT